MSRWMTRDVSSPWHRHRHVHDTHTPTPSICSHMALLIRLLVLVDQLSNICRWGLLDTRRTPTLQLHLNWSYVRRPPPMTGCRNVPAHHLYERRRLHTLLRWAGRWESADYDFPCVQDARRESFQIIKKKVAWTMTLPTRSA